MNLNITDLSSKPPLTQGLRLELHLKEVKDLLQLTLRLIVVILKSLSRNILLIDADFEKTIPWANPWSIKKEELVSGLEDKVFVSTIDGFRVFRFIRIQRGRLVGPSAFGPVTGAMNVIVVSDIAKPATETLQFSLSCVLLDFVLPGNLQNTVTWSVETWKLCKELLLTLSKSAREDSMLSTGIFSAWDSESEGFEWLGDCGGGAILGE